ncbi:MAG: S-layer protein, partial [Candidatus Aenigmatarchaeota archaeon]
METSKSALRSQATSSYKLSGEVVNTKNQVINEMQLRKLAAGALGAIMTGATLAFPAAAASLADYPAPFMKNGNTNFSIVLGSDAAAQDVVGAVEIAATLGGYSYEKATAQTQGISQWSASSGA